MPARPLSNTPWRVHLVCYLLLSGLFAWILVGRYLRPLVFEESVTVEPALVGLVETRIDPNTATCTELTRLPEIGEALAGAIVDYREQQRASRSVGPETPVFMIPEDLCAVRGIGPRTLERIAPYLKLPSTLSETAGE